MTILIMVLIETMIFIEISMPLPELNKIVYKQLKKSFIKTLSVLLKNHCVSHNNVISY